MVRTLVQHIWGLNLSVVIFSIVNAKTKVKAKICGQEQVQKNGVHRQGAGLSIKKIGIKYIIK